MPSGSRDVDGADSADPWELAGRWYEARKYAVSLALLPKERYGTAFEPGCSIGVLTALLGPRCDRLLACDAVPDAVASARKRTAGLPGVRVRAGDQVHEDQAACAGLTRLARYRDPDFTAEVYARADGDLRSVAQAGGIV